MWVVQRKAQLATAVLATAVSLFLSTVFDRNPKTAFGGYDVSAAAILGLVNFPLSFAATVGHLLPGLPAATELVLALLYWPCLALLVWRFFCRFRFTYVLAITVLLVAPASSMSNVFAGMMSA